MLQLPKKFHLPLRASQDGKQDRALYTLDKGPRELRCISQEGFQWPQVLASSCIEKSTKSFTWDMFFVVSSKFVPRCMQWQPSPIFLLGKSHGWRCWQATEESGTALWLNSNSMLVFQYDCMYFLDKNIRIYWLLSYFSSPTSLQLGVVYSELLSSYLHEFE